ncbi:MAG: GNAT family N-acetyltransferase [Planctomycetales bacterium]|nr:GNAT family N-acetyltransferase [Planctomycetales bacterium]
MARKSEHTFRPETLRPMTSRPVTLRAAVTPADLGAVRAIVEATGFFREDEIDIAVELVECRLDKGPASGYDFLFAESDNLVVGYACFGPIPCTLGSYDLYWIAVSPTCQRDGVGRRLLFEVESQVACAGGRCIYIETSGRPQYAPTREFYQTCGYAVAAVLPDFYDDGDDKVIWHKTLARHE